MLLDSPCGGGILLGSVGLWVVLHKGSTEGERSGDPIDDRSALWVQAAALPWIWLLWLNWWMQLSGALSIVLACIKNM